MSAAPTITDADAFRASICQNIHNILTTTATAGGAEPPEEKLARNLEKSVYNFTIREANAKKIVKKWENTYFVHIYLDRLRSITTNLQNNTGFAAKIARGEIAAAQLSTMGHLEFSPDQWKELIDLKIKRDANKFNVGEVPTTDMFKCKKCGARKAQYYELQVRSADEPSTLFLTCVNCGCKWRIG